MVDLGALPASFTYSLAYAVNNSAVVVGVSDSGSGYHAVVWLPVGLDSAEQKQMEGLIGLVDEMILAEAIDDSLAAALWAKLSAANDALARGNEKAAIGLLESTVAQVIALAAADRIDPDTAGDLVGDLESVLALLNP